MKIVLKLCTSVFFKGDGGSACARLAEMYQSVFAEMEIAGSCAAFPFDIFATSQRKLEVVVQISREATSEAPDLDIGRFGLGL